MIPKCLKYLLLISVCSVSAVVRGDNDILHIEGLLLKADQMLKADPSKAIYYSNEALLESRKAGDESYITKSQVILGEAYINLGDFDMGFEVLTNAVETCPPDCVRIQAHLFRNLSGSYLKLRDLNKAFMYIDKALDIYRSLGDSLNLARCYNSRGLVYIHVPDNIRAEKNFLKALSINRKINNVASIAVNLNNLCLYEGDSNEKIKMLREAISINKSRGNVWSLGENYNNLGTQYFYSHQYEKALRVLDTAMHYSEQVNAKELVSDNYRYKSWVYEARENYRAAYQNLLALFEAEKELVRMNEIRRVELNISQKRLRDKEQKMQKQSFHIRTLYLSIAVAILAVIALALSYALFRHRQKKKIQLLEASRKLENREKELINLKLRQATHDANVIQQELEHNRKELTNMAFFMRSRNKLFTQIQEQVRECYKLSGTDAERKMRNLNAYISQFSTKNTETEVLIDELNEHFINKLSEQHPGLSKNEKRLASLLRIGLSTKEIASIINSAPKSVNMARYRLRKHLNLETDENLTEYMKNF